MDLRALALAALVLSLSAPASRADGGDDQYHIVAGLVEKGFHDLAVPEAQAFLRDYPRHPRAELCRYRLATSLFELGRTSEARDEYAVLADSRGFEFRGECRFRLGQCLLDEGRHADAAASFAAVLRDGPDYLRLPATFLLGEAEFARENWQAADDHYAQALAADSASEYASHAVYGRAWCAFRRGDPVAVEARAAEFLERWPGDEAAGELTFLLGEARLADAKPREALAAYGDVPAGPHRAGALRGAAFAHSALGEDAAAAEAFGRLLAESPASPFAGEAALQRGVHLLRAGDAPAASRALSDPRVEASPEAEFWRGEAARAEGDADAALAHYERALGARPEAGLAARIEAGRGDALTALGRSDEAAQAYSRANSDYALQAAAIAHVNAGRTEDAVRVARELLERYPDSPYAQKARLALGEGLFAAGDWAGAERAFAEVLRDAPEGADPALRSRALSRLAWCRFYAGDHAAAAEAFGRVAADFGQGAEAEEARSMRGRALFAAGRTDEARAAWNEYLQQHPRGAWRARVHWELAQEGVAANAEERTLHLRATLDAEPADELRASATFALAEALSAGDHPEEAASTYAAYLARWPEGESAAAARYGQGWLHYQAGRADEAAAALVALGSDETAEPELRSAALELAVWCARAAGDADTALAAWRAFTSLSSDGARRASAARTTASALREAGRLDEAQRLLDDELQVAPRAEAVPLVVEGAYLALERGHTAEAAERLGVARKLAPRDPDVAEAAFFVAEARFDAGEHEAAVALYREARRAPDSPVAVAALYKEGFALLAVGRPAEAAAAFEQLVAEHPDDALVGEALFLAGESYVRSGQYADAVAPLERHLAEHPRHEARPKALFRSGVALGELERWSEAEARLTELARKQAEYGASFDNWAEAELWRGRALAARGARREARGAYERVLTLDRGVLAARARLGLGDLARDAGETENALAEYLKVAVLFASDEEVATALYSAGGCLEDLGDAERAAQQYREILAEHPESSSAEEARRALERLAQ